jgi:hypothetical protein
VPTVPVLDLCGDRPWSCTTEGLCHRHSANEDGSYWRKIVETRWSNEGSPSLSMYFKFTQIYIYICIASVFFLNSIHLISNHPIFPSFLLILNFDFHIYFRLPFARKSWVLLEDDAQIISSWGPYTTTSGTAGLGCWSHAPARSQ